MCVVVAFDNEDVKMCVDEKMYIFKVDLARSKVLRLTDDFRSDIQQSLPLLLRRSRIWSASSDPFSLWIQIDEAAVCQCGGSDVPRASY